MWPSVTATANDLSKNDVGKLAHKLKQDHAERVLLAYGDTDSAVAELQRALKIPDDGIFGPQTRAAVKTFQKEHGLLPTGKVDVKTWLKLFPTDMIVYAPPGSTSALGVNDTDEPEWAAVSAADAGAPAIANAAVSGKQAKKKHKDARQASVHAASASIGTTGPPVAIGPNGSPGGGGAPGVPGVLGGVVAPNGGGGGGGGGSFNFPPLSKFGSAKEMIRAMISMANRIDSKHYAYRWGGGHNGSFSGPYDCSGAVSAVLHAAGLLNRPRVSGEFMHWGAPGRGAVTIYANAGHVYMSILGRFFGTTHANPGGGAGWFPGAPRSGFAVVHVPFSALHLKGKKKHKRHKRRHRRRRAHQQGPLNQPATTAPPETSGGSQAPPQSSSPPPSTAPTTTTASTQPATNYSPPAQTAPTASPQAAPTPNSVTAAPVQQAGVAPSAAPVPNAAPAPSAPSVSTPVQPSAGSGQGPNGTPEPDPPAAPQAPVGNQGTSAGTPSGSPAPATSPNGQQQPKQPAPSASPTAQQAVTEGGQSVAEAAKAAGPPNAPAARPSGPPAGKGPQGAGPSK